MLQESISALLTASWQRTTDDAGIAGSVALRAALAPRRIRRFPHGHVGVAIAVLRWAAAGHWLRHAEWSAVAFGSWAIVLKSVALDALTLRDENAAPQLSASATLEIRWHSMKVFNQLSLNSLLVDSRDRKAKSSSVEGSRWARTDLGSTSARTGLGSTLVRRASGSTMVGSKGHTFSERSSRSKRIRWHSKHFVLTLIFKIFFVFTRIWKVEPIWSRSER